MSTGPGSALLTLGKPYVSFSYLKIQSKDSALLNLQGWFRVKWDSVCERARKKIKYYTDASSADIKEYAYSF